MSEPNQEGFTKGEARCAACGGVIRYEFTTTDPRALMDTVVPCSGCPRDYELEVVEEDGVVRVRARDYTERM